MRWKLTALCGTIALVSLIAALVTTRDRVTSTPPEATVRIGSYTSEEHGMEAGALLVEWRLQTIGFDDAEVVLRSPRQASDGWSLQYWSDETISDDLIRLTLAGGDVTVRVVDEADIPTCDRDERVSDEDPYTAGFVDSAQGCVGLQPLLYRFDDIAVFKSSRESLSFELSDAESEDLAALPREFDESVAVLVDRFVVATYPTDDPLIANGRIPTAEIPEPLPGALELAVAGPDLPILSFSAPER